ncbi:MAG: beta-eliminating lyase-related protein [Chloroflexi bacterium]|nr:beta-eliminating lyase-related protein [Chloroflexota bacterium]
MTDRDIEAIRASCTHVLNRHITPTIRESLQALADFAPDDSRPDMYGSGDLINTFEQEVASLLGHESAVFMPSGTMAQQIALRIWAERQNNFNVAFHPTSHLEVHEQTAYRELHSLRGILVGNPHRLMTMEDLKRVASPLGALLIELPQREIGGALPTWDELSEIIEWAQQKDIKLHLDGARLWECKPFYGRDYAEIAGQFDSVYVSFYKIMGGIAGAILAGPDDFIREAKIWQRRHGGNLVQMYPYVLSAKIGMEKIMPRLQTFHDKAVEIAAAISQHPAIEVTPDPPLTNMMHIFLKASGKALKEASLDIAEEHGLWMGPWFGPTQIPAYQKYELSVAEQAVSLETDYISRRFAELVERAQAYDAEWNKVPDESNIST